MPSPTDFRLLGLNAAPYTPMTRDGRVNLEVIPEYVEFLIESGVKGAFICGSTGECHSLSSSERRELAERWVSAGKGRLAVVVQVGHNSLPEARALAAHAAEIGADAISAMAPSYYKPPSLVELLDFCARIATAAPRLPFYYYHIPEMTGVPVPLDEFLDRGADLIPSLTGAKFSHGDLMMLQECLAVRGGAFDMVFGSDESLLAALALGVKGAVGSTYNLIAPVYIRMIKDFENGDVDAARREQLRSVELVRAMNRFGQLRTGKAIMGMLGIDCGTVRPPLRAMTTDDASRIHDAIKHMDAFSKPLGAPR